MDGWLEVGNDIFQFPFGDGEKPGRCRLLVSGSVIHMKKRGWVNKFEDWYKSHEEVYSENSRYMDPIRIGFKMSIPNPVPKRTLFLFPPAWPGKEEGQGGLEGRFCSTLWRTSGQKPFQSSKARASDSRSTIWWGRRGWFVIFVLIWSSKKMVPILQVVATRDLEFYIYFCEVWIENIGVYGGCCFKGSSWFGGYRRLVVDDGPWMLWVGWFGSCSVEVHLRGFWDEPLSRQPLKNATKLNLPHLPEKNKSVTSTIQSISRLLDKVSPPSYANFRAKPSGSTGASHMWIHVIQCLLIMGPCQGTIVRIQPR